MSRRSTDRRKARRAKSRNRWPQNENTDRVCGPIGVEFVASLDYSSSRPREPAKAPRD